ncbi:MAG: hypothetical protein LBE55_04695 [Clostridiales bacterium]|nr:hypothetical protein [Clostridiales bacterium]
MLISHILKLIFHILLLAAALILYFTKQGREFGAAFLWIVWPALAVPMLFRLFPNKRIAMGARKHFACSYNPAPLAEMPAKGKAPHKGALFCALGWLSITAAMIFALFWLGMLSPETVLIIALGYAVVDLVFVLFFCPFRTLFMGNRCCVICRIHNWDYFMKCAPLILFPSVFSISLFALSAAVALQWEISLRRNPQYFMQETNKNLHCAACEDKLCKLRIGKPRKSG